MSLLDTTNCPNGSMGLSWGVQLNAINPKKKNRWLFSIPGVVLGSAPALPPRKGARPAISMKEYEFQHLHESVWFPLKGSWKTINLVLYDIVCNQNAVFTWLQSIYDPSQDFDDVSFGFAVGSGFKIPTGVKMELYDGCGNVMETWWFEGVYASDINWGELDMDSSELVMVDLTLRYDRAYFSETGAR